MNNKTLLITIIAIVAAAAIGVGGYFLYDYLKEDEKDNGTMPVAPYNGTINVGGVTDPSNPIFAGDWSPSIPQIDLEDPMNGQSAQSQATTTTPPTTTAPQASATAPLSSIIILSQPQDCFTEVNQVATVTVEAVGEGLTYTWYVCDVQEPGVYYLSPSKTTNTYSITLTPDRVGRKAYCVITDKYGNSVTSDTATLYAKDAP